MILSNQAKCLECGDVPYSAHTYDFKYCKCGNVFVDGGQSYIRHGYRKMNSYENMSIEIPDYVAETALSALEWCDETGRNNLGRLCAVFIALRDTGYLEALAAKDGSNDQ